jgi:LDH2 family malate/lactate/ureidoglycolate dehydrogenase
MNKLQKNQNDDLTEEQFLKLLKAKFKNHQSVKTLTKREAFGAIKTALEKREKPKHAVIHLRLPKDTADDIRTESKRNGITTNSFLKQYLIELQERIKQKELKRQTMHKVIKANESKR